MKQIALTGLLVFLFFFGCAHRNASVAPDAPADTSSQAAAGGDLQTTGTPTADGESILETENPGYVADPIAPWNRAVFQFNDKFYFWFLKPVATGYRAVMPQLVRTGIQNFFTNLAGPLRFVSCVLQGKEEDAAHEFNRFFVNTIAGVLGFGNPAGKIPDLNPPKEDLGQTLGSYGIGNGFYIVWPFLGPSTLRDSVGSLGDFFLYPVSYVRPLEAWIAVRGTQAVNETSLRIGEYESLKEAAISPYEAFRDAYIQHRRKQVTK